MIMFRINKTNQEQDPTTLKIVLILQKYTLISGLRMSEGGNASDFKTFHWLLAATFISFLSGVASRLYKTCIALTEQDRKH